MFVDGQVFFSRAFVRVSGRRTVGLVVRSNRII